jgi:phosphohistidine phosphatase
MRLFLLRHGTAEERNPDGSDRPDRRLVDKGAEQARLAGLLLRHLGRLDRVLSSPYARARETAQVALEAFGAAPELQLCDALEPSATVDAALSAVVESAAPNQRVLVVGHEPLLTEIAAELIGDAAASIDLRKGGLIELDLLSLRPPRADLLGLLRPRFLRR